MPSLNKILVTCCCSVLAACGGNVGDTDPDGPIGSDDGRIQLELTGQQLNSSQQLVQGNPTGNGKMDQVEHINVTISKVTAHSNSQGWVELFSGTPITIDLLDLKNSTATLGFKNLPAGKITQIRLYTTEGATQNVVLRSGQTVDLKVPSGLQSGIKVKGLFDLKACTKTTLSFGFVGHKSIWVHPTGQGDLWILRPVIHAATTQGQALPCNSGGSGGGSGAGGSGGSGGTVPGGGLGGSGGTTDPKDPNLPIGGIGGSGGTTTPGGPTLIETGGPCSGSAQCYSGACISGVCAPGGSGSVCNLNNGCVSGLCQSGTCAPPTGAGGTGTTCTANTGCLSGSCIGGVCDPGATGQPCAASADCTSGLSCVQGSCVVPIN